jgi:hypothetical protein
MVAPAKAAVKASSCPLVVGKQAGSVRSFFDDELAGGALVSGRA